RDSFSSGIASRKILSGVALRSRESRIRSILGAFLFRGDDVEKPVRVLSGGEKARVALARMMAQPANLLLLDEPTNHLDLQSRAVLEQALAEFAGTVVIVSHDRYFINRIAKRIVEIEPGGRASSFLGNYDYYAWKKAEVADTGVAQAVTSEPTDYKARKRAQREQERAQRRAAELERAIEDLEARMSEVDARMVEAASDSAKLQGLHDERQQMDAELTDLYAEWERSHLSA
ncbi:MAG: ATP-binding cassette domain-containing protein, partial [Myxococcota bacterium]